jgi:hypothetical protein
VSRSIDLFINSDLPIDGLATRLRAVAGVLGDVRVLHDVSGWLVADGPIVARLHRHPYLDDGDLQLTRYRYALSCRVGPQVDPVDSPEAALLRRVADHLARAETMVLLVVDLEYRATDGPVTGSPVTGSPVTGSPVTEGRWA